MRWNSYVAVGDSFTEGLEDVHSNGRHRGWADRLAERLSQDAPEFGYANLAIRGRKLAAITREQIPQAVALRPDLISIAGGVNDALRPSFDADVAADLLEEGVAPARASGAEVMVVSFGRPSRRSRALAPVEERLRVYRDGIIDIVQRHDCYFLDLWDEPLFEDARFWAPDRLHLNEVGHERIAGAALEALGQPTFDWRQPLPTASPPSRLSAAARHAEWTLVHLCPWLARRVVGKSSGDGIEPKRPALSPIGPRTSSGASTPIRSPAPSATPGPDRHPRSVPT